MSNLNIAVLMFVVWLMSGVLFSISIEHKIDRNGFYKTLNGYILVLETNSTKEKE